MAAFNIIIFTPTFSHCLFVLWLPFQRLYFAHSGHWISVGNISFSYILFDLFFSFCLGLLKSYFIWFKRVDHHMVLLCVGLYRSACLGLHRIGHTTVRDILYYHRNVLWSQIRVYGHHPGCKLYDRACKWFYQPSVCVLFQYWSIFIMMLCTGNGHKESTSEEKLHEAGIFDIIIKPLVLKADSHKARNVSDRHAMTAKIAV